MIRRSAWMFAVLALGSVVAAQDAIPPEALASVKQATVFIQVSGPNHKATGSGFVVKADGDTLLIATNHHVIGLPENDKKARLTPSELSKSLRQVTINAVFGPGTKSEASYKAEPLAADPDEDLAILRVTKVKDPPKLIPYAAATKLSETMPVYTFGFPFGAALATGKGAPAVTVGKGSISSLRLDDSGELAIVQIDGALNPGNSGGPVVDAKGQLVGVAVATIKNGQGIGFAVPGAELDKIMKGRLGGVHLTSNAAAGKRSTKVEVEVVDPTGAVIGVKVLYVLVPPNGKKPDVGQSLEKHPNVKSVTLKPTGDLAAGDLPLDSADGTLYVQAVPQGGLGEKGASAMKDFGMSAKGLAGGFAGNTGPAVDLKVPALNAKPPEGWKDYMPKDRTFKLWVPVNNAGQRDSERTQTSNGIRLKFNIMTLDTGANGAFIAEEIIVPPGVTTNRRAEFERMFRDILVDAVKGRLTNAFEVRMGLNRGQEYRIESKNSHLRARVFVVSNRIMVVQAEGPREFVESPDSDRYLDSCRLLVGFPGNPPATPRNPNPVPNPPPSGPDVPTTTRGGPDIPAERRSKVQGGNSDTEFAEEQPDGMLIGMEIALGDFLGNQIIYGVRPIFLMNEAEKPGQWRGGKLVNRQVRRIVAKPGYALGAISLKTGLGIDAVNLTFMRVADGKLIPADQYSSGQIGGDGGGGWTKLGGTDNRVPIGLISRSMPEWVSGLGLIYADAPPPPPEPMMPPKAFPPPKSFAPPPTPGPAETPPVKRPPQTVTPPTTPSTSATTDEEPVKKSKVPLILGVVGGAVFLLTGIGLLVFVLGKSNQKSSGRRNRKRSTRYDDDDDDDDDRPRRRSRR